MLGKVLMLCVLNIAGMTLLVNIGNELKEQLEGIEKERNEEMENIVKNALRKNKDVAK